MPLTRKVSDDEELRIRSLKGTISDKQLRIEIGRILGVNRARRDEIFRRMFDGLGLPEKHKAKVTFEKDSGVIEATTGDVKSLDELLKECKVDLTIWEVERCVINKWAIARKSTTKKLEWKSGSVTGTETDDGQMTVQPLYQIKAWLKRRVPSDVAAAIQDLKNDLLKESPIRQSIRRKKYDNGVLCEIAPFDLHFGKLAWGEETGEDYDSKIARDVFLKAIDGLLTHTAKYDVEKFIFPVGQDFLHVDNDNNETTAGTRLDADSRFKKIFRDGRRLLVEAIERLRAIAPVDVLVVPGNHDTVSMFHLGDALECYYHNDKDVKIDNSPKDRKYYQYGQCLIAFCHGKDEKMADLPLIMASEAPQMWAETKWREYHVGHLHHAKGFVSLSGDEFRGVRISVLPSLSAIDQWHKSHGYFATRAAEAFLWQKDQGRIATFSYNV